VRLLASNASGSFSICAPFLECVAERVLNTPIAPACGPRVSYPLFASAYPQSSSSICGCRYCPEFFALLIRAEARSKCRTTSACSSWPATHLNSTGPKHVAIFAPEQLSNRVFDSYEAIVDACCDTWNAPPLSQVASGQSRYAHGHPLFSDVVGIILWPVSEQVRANRPRPCRNPSPTILK
jgi:hypothetical protein